MKTTPSAPMNCGYYILADYSSLRICKLRGFWTSVGLFIWLQVYLVYTLLVCIFSL